MQIIEMEKSFNFPPLVNPFTALVSCGNLWPGPFPAQISCSWQIHAITSCHTSGYGNLLGRLQEAVLSVISARWSGSTCTGGHPILETASFHRSLWESTSVQQLRLQASMLPAVHPSCLEVALCTKQLYYHHLCILSGMGLNPLAARGG